MKTYKLLLILLICMNTLVANNIIPQNKIQNKKVSLQLQWKYQFQFAGFIMAKEKGFYKDIGLDVNIKEWNHAINMTDNVINGNSTYCVARPTTLIDIANGKDIIFLATIFQSSPLALVTTKRSGIKSIKDFKNKRMMSTEDMNSDASFTSMLFSQGIDIEDMIIQKPSFNVKDLIDGKTDLIASYISNEPFVLKELGAEPIIFSPKEYGFNFYNDILITSKQYLKKHPKEVEQFTSASLKGWEYAFANIDETVEVIFNKYNTQNKSKDALMYEAKELKKLAYFETKKIGKLEKYKLEKIYDVYKLLGLVKKDIDFDELIFNPIKSSIVLTQEEQKYLKNKKELTVCVNPNLLPYEAMKNGKYIGISADYLNIISKNLGIPLRILSSKTNTDTLKLIKNKKCDIKSIALNGKLPLPYKTTKVYIEDYISLVTDIQQPFMHNLDKYINKTFVMIDTQHGIVAYIKRLYPNIKLTFVKSADEALKMIVNKKAFGFIGKSLSSIHYIQKHYPSKLKVVNEFQKANLGIGVVKDDKILLNIMNKALNSINEKEKIKIRNNWVTTTTEKEFDYTAIWKIFGVVFIIILFFIYRQILLKNQNKNLEILVNEKTKTLNEVNKNLEDTVKIRTDELSENLKFIQSLLDSVIFGVVQSNKDGKCIDVNESTLNIMLYKNKSDLIGLNIFDLISDSSKELARKNIMNNYTEPYEIKLINSKGKDFSVLIKGKTIVRNGQQIRLSTFVDISNVKKQEQIIAAQSKMASMGEMIGNIAHQWRQPLSVISTASTGMKIQKEYGILTDELFIQSCDAINDNAQYLSKTIDDFKNFIKGDRAKNIFTLKDDVNSFLHLVEGTIKSNNITTILNLQEDIEIDGYENELIQCLINIFNNAKDALKDMKSDKYIFIATSTKDNTAIIKIKDNAGGISKDILAKIFDPYFTTKHASQGTGLGLDITYRLIVDGMSGTIEAHNVEFKHDNIEYTGAEFVISLPMS